MKYLLGKLWLLVLKKVLFVVFCAFGLNSTWSAMVMAIPSVSVYPVGHLCPHLFISSLSALVLVVPCTQRGPESAPFRWVEPTPIYYCSMLHLSPSIISYYVHFILAVALSLGCVFFALFWPRILGVPDGVRSLPSAPCPPPA